MNRKNRFKISFNFEQGKLVLVTSETVRDIKVFQIF